MNAVPGVLDLPVQRGARRLALVFLRDAEAAHARLEQGRDDHALHDFRVAVRRLRSAVRAYGDHLAGSVRKKDRKTLAELAAATGEARDLEVHAAWIAARLDAFTEDERPAAAAALLDDLRAEQGKAEHGVRKRVAKEFPKARWRLARRIRFYRQEVDVDAPEGGARLSAVLGEQMLELAADLERRLAGVRTLDDQRAAHRARIAAKRLRYLVEPVADELDGAPPLIKRLKRLQDALGEMHDADVLLARVAKQAAADESSSAASTSAKSTPAASSSAANDDGAVDRDPSTEADRDGSASAEGVTDGGAAASPGAGTGADGGAGASSAEAVGEPAGLAALREMLERERAERFAAVAAEWLNGRAAGFFAAVREVAHAAVSRGEPDREIERKYLLKRMPAIRALGFRVQEIEQGYLPGEKLAERVRRVREGGEVRYYRTIKFGKGISRVEVEEETDLFFFRRVWPLTRGKRVRKRRYKVPEGGFVWEVDRFRDRRLVLCEVELPSEDTDAPLPRWLRRELVREVTGEDEFVNLNLAK